MKTTTKRDQREAEKQAHERNLLALPFLERESLLRQRRGEEWWGLAYTFSWYALLALGLSFVKPSVAGYVIVACVVAAHIQLMFGLVAIQFQFKRQVARRVKNRGMVRDPFLRAAEPVVAAEP